MRSFMKDAGFSRAVPGADHAHALEDVREHLIQRHHWVYARCSLR
ncbi:MAG TPA: hypothetical protein VM528_03600 [Burkholderiaceae bacterium]|nr:hypothetical protein [Burkholderiaceae bacterium]